MQQLSEGLYVLVLGMGIVFLALTALMFSIMLLDRLFRVKDSAAEAGAGLPVAAVPGGEPTTSPLDPDVATVREPHAEVAVAIAVALARARGQRQHNGRASFPVALGDTNNERWDWVWDEGVDDYGSATVRG